MFEQDDDRSNVVVFNGDSIATRPQWRILFLTAVTGRLSQKVCSGWLTWGRNSNIKFSLILATIDRMDYLERQWKIRLMTMWWTLAAKVAPFGIADETKILSRFTIAIIKHTQLSNARRWTSSALVQRYVLTSTDFADCFLLNWQAFINDAHIYLSYISGASALCNTVQSVRITASSLLLPRPSHGNNYTL